MATEVVIEARKRFVHPTISDEDMRALDHLIDLVEEYGDALLAATRSGSEFFRANGTEVDPKACLEYIRHQQQTTVKFAMEARTLRLALSRIVSDELLKLPASEAHDACKNIAAEALGTPTPDPNPIIEAALNWYAHIEDAL